MIVPAATAVGLDDSAQTFESTEELRAAVDRYDGKDKYDAQLARTYGWPIGSWCVSNIQDFSELFYGYANFNEDLYANFNEDLDGWDTSKATNMGIMFGGAGSFNGNVTTWDTSSVQTMASMFFGAKDI